MREPILISNEILKLPATEVVRLLRSGMISAFGQRELNVTVNMDYVIGEEFDGKAYGIPDAEQFDLVRSVATLTIEPRVESGYWIPEASVERLIGPVRVSNEARFAFKELSLDEFEAELRAPGNKRIIAKFHVQMPEIRQEFSRWL